MREGGGGRRSSSCWNGMRKLVLRKEEEATARVSGVTTAWSTRQACRKRDDTVRGCCAVSEARLQEDPLNLKNYLLVVFFYYIINFRVFYSISFFFRIY